MRELSTNGEDGCMSQRLVNDDVAHTHTRSNHQDVDTWNHIHTHNHPFIQPSTHARAHAHTRGTNTARVLEMEPRTLLDLQHADPPVQ